MEPKSQNTRTDLGRGMGRKPCCNRNRVKKGTWTPEEDKKLIAYVTRYGCWNWRQIPKYAGLPRCGKSCRLRWMNYLRPNLKRGNYSQEEEDLIIELHESLGNRWSAIAARLPGRSDNEVKNHWHSYLKKRSKEVSVSQEQEQELSSNVICQHGCTDQEITAKNDNSPILPETHQFLESSLFFPQPSMNEPWSVSSTTTVPSFTSFFIEEDDIFRAEIFEELIGDFWKEPFFPKDYFNTGCTDHKITSKNENCHLLPETHHILESSIFSPQPSTNESLSVSSATTIPRSASFFTEGDDIFRAEIFEESSGNFWTEPFLPENYYTSFTTPEQQPFPATIS